MPTSINLDHFSWQVFSHPYDYFPMCQLYLTTLQPTGTEPKSSCRQRKELSGHGSFPRTLGAADALPQHHSCSLHTPLPLGCLWLCLCTNTVFPHCWRINECISKKLLKPEQLLLHLSSPRHHLSRKSN